MFMKTDLKVVFIIYNTLYNPFSLTGHPLTGLLVNRTDGVPRYLDSLVNGCPVNECPVNGCPVNGNGAHKIRYPDKRESG